MPEKKPTSPNPVVTWFGDFLDIGALSTRETPTLETVEHLNNQLRATLRGQEVAIDIIVKGLQRLAAGVTLNPHRPLSFLFVGPAGTGKTQIVKTTADALGRRLLRYDMGQYKDNSVLWTLWGSPQGYAGGTGKLTEAVKSTPDAVILFDAVEKAHPEIYDSLHPLLDEGNVKDRRTDTAVNFSKTIVAFTSNLLQEIPDEVYADPERARDLIVETKFFKIDFINRVQFIVPFRALSPTVIHDIAVDQLNRFADAIEKEQRCKVSLDGRVPGFLVNKANLKFGAQDLEQLIMRYVADPFTEAVVARQGAAFEHTIIRVQNDAVTVELT